MTKAAPDSSAPTSSERRRPKRSAMAPVGTSSRNMNSEKAPSSTNMRV